MYYELRICQLLQKYKNMQEDLKKITRSMRQVKPEICKDIYTKQNMLVGT